MAGIYSYGCNQTHETKPKKTAKHSHGCGSINCHHNNSTVKSQYGYMIGEMLAFGAMTIAPRLVAGAVNALANSTNRSSEEIQAEIDDFYSSYGVADREGLVAQSETANETLSAINQAIGTAQGEYDNIKAEIPSLETKFLSAKEAYEIAQKNLKAADPNAEGYQALVDAYNLAKSEKERAEKTLNDKKAELYRKEGQLKQLKAEQKAKKAEYDAIMKAINKADRLENGLLRAQEREEREAERAEGAEAKRRREEEIDHLINGDTTAISKLLKQIRRVESLGLQERKAILEEQLHAALEQYYVSHNVGDNKTIDALPEAKIHFPAV